jgi:hypothetical protein
VGTGAVGVVVAPGEVVAPGVVAGGVVAPGVVTVGVVAVVTGVVAVAAGVETTAAVVVVLDGEDEPESPASATSAATSTASASTAATPRWKGPIAVVAAAARRVRAAAPHCRHHSWCGCRGVPHSGQASIGCCGVGVEPVAGAGGAAVLTIPARAGG